MKQINTPSNPSVPTNKGKGVSTEVEPEIPLSFFSKEIHLLNRKVDSNTPLSPNVQATPSKSTKPLARSSKSVKSKSNTFKPCKLCRYDNHISNDCCGVLFCKRCKKDDHRTPEHTLHISMMRNVYKYEYQFSYRKLLKKTTMKAKPFLPCVHCGFKDHHFDDSFDYFGCDICGSNGYYTYDHEQIIQIIRDQKIEPSQFKSPLGSGFKRN